MNNRTIREMIGLQRWVTTRRLCWMWLCSWCRDWHMSWLHGPSNYRGAVLNHPGTSGSLIWSCGARRGLVISQSTRDAGLNRSPLGCVAKTPDQNVLKIQMSEQISGLLLPCGPHRSGETPFNGSNVSSSRRIKQKPQQLPEHRVEHRRSPGPRNGPEPRRH